jgi:hypothetical protein
LSPWFSIDAKFDDQKLKQILNRRPHASTAQRKVKVRLSMPGENWASVAD